ncbi:MAG: TolC family protein [Bacteroidota bacterium]|nr:TolC family protein [Bacteroidota bacterium]
MKPYFLALWALMLLLFLTGCATPRDAAWPQSRPLGNTLPAYQPPVLPTTRDTLHAEDSAPSNVLSLREALVLALLHNPDLRAFAWEVRAHEARTLQTGLRPNPEFVTDLEDFGGSRALSGFHSTETTVGLSQLIELGGDRHRRHRVAVFERDLAGWDYETVRLDVLTKTAQAFTGVLAAQERLTLADSLLAQAQQFYESVAARVESGKVSALEERRAQVVLSTTRLTYERTTWDLAAKRTRLAAAWGGSTPTFERVTGDLAAVEAVPPAQRLGNFIERNPDVARWRDEMALRRAGVALERARGIPDPVFIVGIRRVRELHESALAAGISIPLPLFDRNQGTVREAKYRLRQGEEAQQAAQVKARRMLAEAYGQLASAYSEVNTLQQDVLPAAQEAFTATEEGYLEGKFDLLMLLDAQRTLFETTNQYIDALAVYHIARAEVERLIGTPLSDI